MLQPERLRPQTEAERGPTESSRQRREAEAGEPFTFTPQIFRLHRDHELFEDGDVHRHMYLQDLYIPEAEDDKPALSVSEFACHISGCSAVFSTVDGYEHHYNSLHRHVCCSCRRSLPSARLLDIHIQEWHDSLFTILAQRQDMYQCLVEGCGQKFRTCKHRKDHLIQIHKYPPDFRFDKHRKDRGSLETRRQQHKDSAMEVVDDVCESEGVCEVMCDVPSNQAELEESMEMRVCGEEAHRTLKSVLPEEDADLSAHDARNTSTDPLKPRYSYRVPPTVCFGHGSVRGFRGRRGRRK